MKTDEWLPLCDEEGKITGRELRSVCHNGRSMHLHPVVHLHIFNKRGDLFMQKRAMHKDVQPGVWDTAVGGHVDPGESIEEALLRETREETGIEDFKYRLLSKYIWESDVERELVHSYITTTDQIPVPDPAEVAEGKFWTIKNIEENLGKGLFTPNFENEFRTLLSSRQLLFR